MYNIKYVCYFIHTEIDNLPFIVGTVKFKEEKLKTVLLPSN